MPVKMLRFIVVLLVCSFTKVLSIPEEMQELIDTLHSTCVGETGATEESIENARKGNFVDDGKLGCYMKCLMDQMGCISDDGIIDEEATIAVLPEEYQAKGDQVIRTCATKIGANPCENIFLTNKCWYENAPDDYFLA